MKGKIFTRCISFSTRPNNINITLRLWYKTEIRSLAILGIMRVVACDVVVTEIMGFPIPIMAFNTSFHLKRNNPFNFL